MIESLAADTRSRICEGLDCDNTLPPERKRWCSEKCGKRTAYLQDRELVRANQDELHCVRCGDVIPEGRRRWCSRECEYADQKTNKFVDERTTATHKGCVTCSGELPLYKRKYCSDECSPHKNTAVPRYCRFCSTQLTWQPVWCSIECQRIGLAVPRYCKRCGGDITHRRWNAEYCDDECKAAHKSKARKKGSLTRRAGRYCKGCGKPIDLKKRHAEYCEKPCGAKARQREKNRLKVEEVETCTTA